MGTNATCEKGYQKEGEENMENGLTQALPISKFSFSSTNFNSFSHKLVSNQNPTLFSLMLFNKFK